jgi:hypothetical protein
VTTPPGRTRASTISLRISAGVLNERIASRLPAPPAGSNPCVSEATGRLASREMPTRRARTRGALRARGGALRRRRRPRGRRQAAPRVRARARHGIAPRDDPRDSDAIGGQPESSCRMTRVRQVQETASVGRADVPDVMGPATAPRWTVENRQFVDRAKPAISGTAETSEFYFVPSSVRKSVCTFVRQLRGPHFSTCA